MKNKVYFTTYGCRYVGLTDGKFEKLWNVEDSGEHYNWNYVEFPDADFMTELKNLIVICGSGCSDY